MELNEGDRLAEVAHELRSAAAVAFAVGSWFAPTLDDCRLDAEKLLATREPSQEEVQLICTRARVALRTWSRIVTLTGIERSRCQSCDDGLLVEVARPGRVVPFRGLQIEVPSDFAIPTCDRCGCETLDERRGARLDALLFAEYLRRI